MIIRPQDVSPRAFYQFLASAVTPRPIAWVSTLSPGGVANLAPYSFFNAVSANPPALIVSVTNRRDGTPKDTLRNVEATGEFVVNIVSHALVVPMNNTSAEVGYETDEFTLTNLEKAPSTIVRPPRVAAAPVAMECTLQQVVKLGSEALAGNVIIGIIRAMHVNEAVLNPDGGIDPHLLDTVGRLGGSTYATTRDRFDLDRPV